VNPKDLERNRERERESSMTCSRVKEYKKIGHENCNTFRSGREKMGTITHEKHE
jgi:hypothetical protein